MLSAQRLPMMHPESEQTMKQEKLEEILVLTRRIGNLFHEVMDISAQLAEAIDRRDEVSMQMIIAMRAEPIGKLTIADRAIREQMDLLGGEDAERIRAILNGDESRAGEGMERLLAEQASMNIRAHRKLMELDEILNKKIGRDKSVYQ